MSSVEAKQGAHAAKDKYAIPPHLERFLNSAIGKYAVKYMVDRVYTHAPDRLFTWEGLEKLEALKKPTLKDQKILLAVTHVSHGDGAEVIAGVNKIDVAAPGRFEKKVYTVAGSMGGEQGPLMAALWNNGVRPYFEKKGITPDMVVSDNDVAERGMVRPEDNGKFTRESMRDPNVLNIVHIEGSTKPGKTNPDTNKRFGRQHMDRGFTGILLQQLRHKIPTYILPMAIEGSDHYFDPNKRGFSREGMIELSKMLTIGEGTTIGKLDEYLTSCFFGEVQWPRKGRVVFGDLVSLQELYTSKRELPGNVIRQLAKISSEPYLGDYGKELLVQKK